VPVFNDWLDECLQAILEQGFPGRMELSVYDDGSDNSRELLERWRLRFEDRGLPMLISGHSSSSPHGVGFAKYQAVCQSSGRFLCFQEVSLCKCVCVCVCESVSIVGCKVCRVPEDSTERYTRWINSLSPVYRSHGPTVIMPAWFCSRDWFEKAGPFNEALGVPEDLLFFYQSLRHGGHVIRVDECLLVYRYHEHAATHSVLEETIWSLRVHFLQERVLSQWESFTAWNAGKQGPQSLSPTNQKKVKAFCDVDENTIQKGFYSYEESKERLKPRIPVLHFTNTSPLFIVCDMTRGVLEENLWSLQLKEGIHYYHFN
uniref:UDP-GlcNAc:betaGal beta-1,3-N-acetylglucosaminyltransferase-like protein 1 n=1 Tax=Sinocyclocheilus grahami TaxID=75366 RepID=A0A672LFK7_SINGR